MHLMRGALLAKRAVVTTSYEPRRTRRIGVEQIQVVPFLRPTSCWKERWICINAILSGPSGHPTTYQQKMHAPENVTKPMMTFVNSLTKGTSIASAPDISTTAVMQLVATTGRQSA